jgi:6-phospho-3-hexuloisomerase
LELTQWPFSCNFKKMCQSLSRRSQGVQMNPQALFKAVLDEHQRLLEGVTGEAVDRLIQELDNAARVFFAAQGRSGYILRCFCMRLMQLGYQAFFVGETITPGIEAGDLLIVLSGSGQTSLTREWVRIAGEKKARAFGILGVKDSPVAGAVHDSLILPAGSKLESAAVSLPAQPPGSLFEQVAFVLLETIVLVICRKRGVDPRTILERHANLE